MKYPAAQTLAFGVMGILGRNPVGRAIIGFLGHSKPAADLCFEHSDLTFPAPVALGCGIDHRAQALSTVSLFGFGLIEVGPVAVDGYPRQSSKVTNLPAWNETGVSIPISPSGVPVAAMIESLGKNRFRNKVPVFARLADDQKVTAEQFDQTVRLLSPLVDGISLCLADEETSGSNEILAERVSCIHDHNLKVLLVVQSQSSPETNFAPSIAQDVNADGIILQGSANTVASRGDLTAETVNQIADDLEHWKQSGFAGLLIANEGVSQPAEALKLMRAGADMVMIDSGLTEAGPGLPKRINAVILAFRQAHQKTPSPVGINDAVPFPHRSWFWSSLLGLSLLIGGLIALIIGATNVVLPYDEEFLGMLRDEICGLNPKLLPFMSHDRVTLAGTMLALGPLYLSLGWFGDRIGMHWARVAVLASAFIGFLSFFLFLGFGYFDPFHAFISAILFQLMALGLRSSQRTEQPSPVDLYNTAAWKRALWGQLLMVLHGFAILVAGVTICSFGVTSVFVADDLEFMQTTRAALVNANPRLVPLVAHDRASFGGMLMSTGVTVLLSSVWGWQAGRRWLWNTLLACGTVAYTTTILIHWYVGYTSLRHLLPAYAGLGVLWLAMWLSREWMTSALPADVSSRSVNEPDAT